MVIIRIFDAQSQSVLSVQTTPTTVMKVFWILSLGCLLQVQAARRQAEAVLTSKERKSLIGHLQTVKSENIVLTERQKLALRQEREFQRQGFSPFSPDSDPGSQSEGLSGEKCVTTSSVEPVILAREH